MLLPAPGHIDTTRGQAATAPQAAEEYTVQPVPQLAVIVVAAAVGDDQCLAVLVRRDGETLCKPLSRLDRAIEMALDDELFIDEVNNGPDERL